MRYLGVFAKHYLWLFVFSDGKRTFGRPSVNKFTSHTVKRNWKHFRVNCALSFISWNLDSEESLTALESPGWKEWKNSWTWTPGLSIIWTVFFICTIVLGFMDFFRTWASFGGRVNYWQGLSLWFGLTNSITKERALDCLQ